MPSVPVHRGEMSQDSEHGRAHRTGVPADASEPTATAPTVTSPGLAPAITPPGLAPAIAPGLAPASTPPGLAPAIDPAARASRRMYEGLSSSAVGLELGIAVVVGILFGMWLDRTLGTEPWLMLVFLILGLVAGFRNVLRAVARAEKAGHG
jgi:hypothetical protein